MPYVDSTMISWVDYDPEARTLSVRLRAVPVLYTYLDVPEQTYRALLEAPSLHGFYQQEIVPAYRLDTQPLSLAGDGSMARSEAGSPGT